MKTSSSDKNAGVVLCQNEAVPLTEETVMIVTELALVGHRYLKALLLGGKLDALDPDPGKAAAAKKHYQSLVETAGPVALESFNRLSQFLFEQNLMSKSAPQSAPQKEDSDAV